MFIQKYRIFSPERHMAPCSPGLIGFSIHLVEDHTASLSAPLQPVNKFRELGVRLSALLAKTSDFASEFQLRRVVIDNVQMGLDGDPAEPGHE